MSAPEACPVAEKPLAWTAFSESSSWTGVWCKTREGAQERVDEFKRRWPKTGPYRVVPLYATPASATAEGGVELWAQGGGRYLDGTNTMCAPIKPHSHVAYPATPAPGAAAPTEAEVEECAKEILGVLPYGATRQALEAGGAVLLARAVLAHVRKARAC